jgi:single-stranded-DNA-specific exonuclease
MQSASRLIANGREERGQHTAMRFLLQMGDAKAELFEDMEAQKKQWESELNKVFRFLDTITVDYEGNGFIYFDDEGVIPYSLLGTAATYIQNKLGTPTIILAPHNGHIVCEGRCSDGFNMVEAFRHCRDLLIQYGGHVKAAGFSLDKENYDAFLECYNEYLKSELDQDHAKREIEVDAKADLADLSVEAWRELELLLPFGQQNPEPVILIRNVSVDDLQKRFNIENCGSNLRSGEQGEAIVSWKGPQTVRLLEFRKRKEHKSR